jgi:hypothetical protein
MKRLEVDVLCEGNLAIVNMPGAQFPALVVPGDFLNVLWGSSESIVASLGHGSASEAATEAGRLVETLRAIRSHYIRSLADNQIVPPFQPIDADGRPLPEVGD